MLAIAIYALGHPSSSKTAAGTPTHTASRTPSKSASPTHRPSATATSSSSSSSSSTGGKLPLVVLNNSTITGLAEQARATFIAGGWQVTSVGNLQNDIISTCAYYDPATPGAQQAAEALMRQFPAIKRTAAKFAELPAGPIVVVLTSGYASG